MLGCFAVALIKVAPWGDDPHMPVFVPKVAKIASNPEQSKHLETARMKVDDVELDLVNLRSETYADQTSRIPTMEFGTPEQDAMR